MLVSIDHLMDAYTLGGQAVRAFQMNPTRHVVVAVLSALLVFAVPSAQAGPLKKGAPFAQARAQLVKGVAAGQRACRRRLRLPRRRNGADRGQDSRS